MTKPKFKASQVVRLRDEPHKFLKIRRVSKSGYTTPGQQWAYDFYGTNNWTKLESELRPLSREERR